MDEPRTILEWLDSVDMALFAAATTVMIRNGLKTSFLHYSWLDGRPPAKLYRTRCCTNIAGEKIVRLEMHSQARIRSEM